MKLQHVILCEGYDDRAFWAGWLLHMGLRDLSRRPDSHRRQQVKDPWDRPVTQGQFGFATASGAFVRLVSCDGGENVAPMAAQFIKGQPTHPVGDLVLNIDADDSVSAPTTRARDIIRRIVMVAGGSPQPDERGCYVAQGITIRPVIWTCSDSDDPGVPAQQTLERLVSAACVSAVPTSGPDVARWLANEPRGGDSHKNYAMSYYAKWFAQDRGPDDFYREIWNRAPVAKELERRLRETGAWAHVESLAQA
jgi:hypothetical protein